MDILNCVMIRKNMELTMKKEPTLKKLITLGPAGTYSEIAAKKFIKELNIQAKIMYEPSIDFCFESFKTADYLVLPLENSIDGYIQRTLDLLNISNAFITHELKLPITFSLVSNETSIEDIETIYVQFKTRNQCQNFFFKYKHFKFVITDSNSQSLLLHQKNPKKTATVIPTHLVKSPHLLTINQLADDQFNQTRFILVDKQKFDHINEINLKALISLTPTLDKPGLLYHLLSYFTNLNINLKSIISRPKASTISAYEFFLEIDVTHKTLEQLIKTISALSNLNIKLLGVYK